jgi:hypothetical protein
MEIYPIRDVSGFGELLWSARQQVRKKKSHGWLPVKGVVERYELLKSGHRAWFVVLYSYEYGGERFSGEWRRWVYSASKIETKIEKLTSVLPLGTRLTLRIDPSNPTSSFPELNI